MFEKYFNDKVKAVLSDYVEDFTSDDILVDKWNGRVVKENMILKPSALMILSKLIGLPFDVTKGYAKRISINVPWSKIWKEPVEIIVEDIHALAKVKGDYSQDFAETMYLDHKNKKINQVLKEIKENREHEEKKDSDKPGFFSGLLAAVSENIRLKFTGIHLRVEDIGSSIDSQSFSFGLICDHIQYNITNKNYDPDKFISKDEKLKENKIFSLLSFKGMALYWISRDSDCWNLSPRIKEKDLHSFIQYSKGFINDLKNRGRSASSNFVIRPFNLTVKFRTDLGSKSDLPTSTVAMSMTPFIVSIDFTIATEVQALMKLREYHSTDIESKVVHAYREHTEEEDKSFESSFQRKTPRSSRNKNQDVKLLSELLTCKMAKEFCDTIAQSYDIVAFKDSDDAIHFKDEAQLDDEIKRLKIILNLDK